MYVQQSIDGVNVQLPHVSGASCSQAVVGVQSVTSTAPSGMHHTLQQQQAPSSHQQISQGSVLTQVRHTDTLIFFLNNTRVLT